MSDLDNAINSINASAAKAENTAGFLDDMSTFDDQSSVTNPNNGQTVASIPKQVKDRTDELFTAAESDINQAVADAEQSATDAQGAADSIGRYQGLWPDTGGIADKGDTYQTQVGGTPTGQYFTALQNTTVDPVGDDVNWRRVVSEQWVADNFSNMNLLSNHNFLVQTPDDSQPRPSATPTSYPPGYQIFSGVFANETTGISNLTYIDGRVSFSGGDLYFAVPNTGGLERLTEFAASVADFDGKPRTRGVSFALVGDEYRVTVGVDALEDESANATPLGSVKFEQGSVATGHEVVQLDYQELKRQLDPLGWGITFSGDESAQAQTMLDEVGIIKIPSGKTLMADVNVSKGFSMIGDDRTSKFVGGITQLDNTVASNVLLKSLSLEVNKNLYFGGISTSNRSKNISYIDLGITITESGVTTCAAKNNDGFVIRDVDITTNIPSSGNAQYAFTMASVSQFDISNVNVKGAFEFGFESGGDGSGATPACWDGDFDNITIVKEGGAPSANGHHGFYLHGFRNVNWSNLNVNGWSDPNYDIKIRDGKEGDFSDTKCDRAFVNSNGGSGITELKKLSDIKFTNFSAEFGSLSVTGSDPDRGIDNVEFRGTTGNFGFGMSSLASNISVTGIYERRGSNVSGSSDGFNLKYKSCTIRSDVEVGGSYIFEGQPNFENCTIEGDLVTVNSSLRVRNTTIQGALRMQPTTGAYTLEMINSHATGELYAYTFGTREIDARIYNSSFGIDERTADTENPSTKTYRGVGFGDGFYATESSKILP